MSFVGFVKILKCTVDPGGGVPLGILGGGMLLSSSNPDPISDQKNVVFHTRF